MQARLQVVNIYNLLYMHLWLIVMLLLHRLTVLQESLEPNKENIEPMHLDVDDLGREDPTALAPIIDKWKTILMEDSDSDDDI